jgi:hypothetical protein
METSGRGSARMRCSEGAGELAAGEQRLALPQPHALPREKIYEAHGADQLRDRAQYTTSYGPRLRIIA